LSEKVEVLGPSIELSALKSNICAEVINTIGISWDEWYGRLTLYKDREGHCSVPAQYKTPDGRRLGSWVSAQRLSQDELSDERKARLNALGFDWDPLDTAWKEGLEHLRAFVNEHKHCRVPAQYKSPGGFKLGGWASRRRLRKDVLSPEQIEILDALGFDWDPITTQWEEGFEHLQAYVRECKDCCVPPRYKSPDGYRLGGWVMEQRYNRDSRSPKRKARLDALGFDWSPRDTAWEEGLVRLKAYAKEHNNCLVSRGYKSPDGFKLGQWVSNWRQKPNSISPERKAQLDALGFDWEPYDTAWEEGLEHLRAFVNEHKHCRVSQQYRSLDGFNLGRWVSKRRLGKDMLSPEQIEIFDALGFDWDPITKQWEEGVEHLRAYVREYKDCRVPPRYKSADGFKLGTWVTNRRIRKHLLSPKQVEILDALGFDWDPITTQWEKGFEHLRAYVKEYANCRIPMLYKSPDGYNLGRWLDNMRQNPNSVSPERKARLNELGFDWKPHDTAWESNLEHLRIFVNEQKHCCVPQQYKSPDGFRLGVWVNTLRRRKDTLSPERIEILDALGFVWKVRRPLDC
jgi:hypothetical protein